MIKKYLDLWYRQPDNMKRLVLVSCVVLFLVFCVAGCASGISSGGKMLRLNCMTIEQHYMNSDAVQKFVNQGIDPCDCVGRKAIRPECRGSSIKRVAR